MADIRTSIDLHGIPCPMDFVMTKLDELTTGDRLEVILDEGEAMVNVSRSLKDEGHRIVKVEPEGETFRVVVEKG